MEIRQALPADAAAMAEIYNWYVKNDTANFRYFPQQAAEIVADMGKNARRFPYLAACENGAVIGYAYAHPWQSGVAFQWTAEVSVYCAEAARGRGAGRRLIGTLCALLREQGYYNAVAQVSQPNEASERLFAAMGFAQAGVLPRIGVKAGQWHGINLWLRPLREGAEKPRAIKPLTPGDWQRILNTQNTAEKY